MKVCLPARRFADMNYRNIFDAHAHYDDGWFDDDRDELFKLLPQKGVCGVVNNAVDLKSEKEILKLCDKYDYFYAAVGFHPENLEDMPDDYLDQIAELAKLEQVVAIGEIGLDYHYDLSPRDAQKLAFDEQLDMAFRLDKPVILHIREAHGDATDMLAARWKAGRLPRGVMHCYTGSWESAKQYLAMGLYISFSGAVTFRNAPKLSEVARNMPLDRLLVETDCPYMVPVPMRGQRNEPAFVAYTARKVAELREMDEDALARAALENGCRLFGIEQGKD